jgi:hypothetical protein
MCDAARKSKFSGLSIKDIQNFPCQDLQMVDKLWRYYSEDHFGFSVQAQLFKEEDEDPDAFFRRIGWYRNGIWIAYSDVTWVKGKAPKGHLPIGGRGGLYTGIGDATGGSGLLGYIRTAFSIANSSIADLFNTGGYDRFFERLKEEVSFKNGYAMCWLRPRLTLIERMKQCEMD